jgi:endoglucanase
MLREIRLASILGMFLAVGTQAGVVKVHGALKVQGNHVVDAYGNPIQVAGMSLYWPEWGGNAFYTAGAVQTMANNWGASVIRAPFPVYTPNSTPADQYNASNESLIKTVVDAAIANDIYVIVDWHVEGDNVEEDHAKTFFGDIAKAYGNSPNVIWEIWNEPISASWSTIKSYANDILAVIRPYNSNLVIVGSPTWSHTPNTPAADPITTDPNIAYTTHFYACSDSTAERATVTSAAAKIPIFFTEWGTTASDGSTGFCTGESDQWLALAKQLGISWTNWSLSNKGGGSAALTSTDVNGGLSASGQYVKAKIQSVGDAISTTEVKNVPPEAGFSASATAHGLTVSLPAGSREIQVTDLQGRTLVHRSISGQSQVQIGLSGQGLVLVRWTGVGGQAVLPVLLSH